MKIKLGKPIVEILAGLTMAFATRVIALEADTPTAVVKGYFQTLAAARSAPEIYKFETQQNVKEHQSMLNNLPTAKRGEYIKFLKMGLPKSIKITSEKIENDSARIAVEAVGKEQMEPPPKQEDPSVQMISQQFGAFFLKRENGQWKIDTQDWESSSAKLPDVNPNDWQSWANDAVKTKFPESPVQGKLDGQEFVPSSCILEQNGFFGGTWLRFLKDKSKGGAEAAISIELFDEVASVEGQCFEIADGKLSWPKQKMFNIICESDKFNGITRTAAGVKICGMKLKFGNVTAKGIPGSIVLRLNSQPETSLAGKFIANIKK